MYEAIPTTSWATTPFTWSGAVTQLKQLEREARAAIQKQDGPIKTETAALRALASPPAKPPADGKIKAAEGKPPMAMLPLKALIGPCRVYAYGAKKYAPGNFYQASMPDAGPRYISAALRHLMAMQHANGTHLRETLTTLDEESGLPHIDHAVCSLLMLRSIMTKNHYLPADPGEGKDPQ